jgi:hypothetical protein
MTEFIEANAWTLVITSWSVVFALAFIGGKNAKVRDAGH